MNRIDITNNRTTHYVKNNVVVVTKKEGIQGPPGKDGKTPYIGESGNWFIAGVDTGVSASGVSKDELNLVYQYESRNQFPSIGTTKDLYIDQSTSIIYRWDNSVGYVELKPNYVSQIETVVSGALSELETVKETKMSKPEKIVPGALVLVDESGNTKCTDLTYDELLKKIDSSSGGTSGSLPTDLVPGFLLVGSEQGSIESSDISMSELKTTLNSVEKKVEFVGNIVPGALVLADESGNLKSSGKTYDQLVEDIQKSSVQSDWNVTDPTDPAFIKNKPVINEPQFDYNELIAVINSKPSISNQIVPGALMVATADGNLECSSVKYEDLVTKNSIVTGTSSAYIDIQSDEVGTIEIPEQIRTYPSISVYQNGKLLIEGVHYALNSNRESIILIGFLAYAKDVFNFVGYGSTVMLPGGNNPGSGTVFPNEEILLGITQERVDAWDTITTHNHDDKYLSKDAIIDPALLPIATDVSVGVVKSSEGVNKVTIADDGTMSIKELDISVLVATEEGDGEGEDYSVVLSSGSSLSYKE